MQVEGIRAGRIDPDGDWNMESITITMEEALLQEVHRPPVQVKTIHLQKNSSIYKSLWS